MPTAPAPHAHGRMPVVAGVSQSDASRTGLAWASDEAALRQLPLRLVHALEWPPGADPDPHVPHPERTWSAHFRSGGEAVLREAVEFVHARHPGLEVEARSADGPRARVLVEQGADAALLVVGAKRLNVAEQLFTVSPLGVTLTAHAGCPVVVAREPEHAVGEPPLVVVGVDGSANSRDAMAFAFEEAAVSGARLRAVMVRYLHRERAVGGERADVENRSRTELSEATAGWREKYPEVEVDYRVRYGHPARVLAHTAANARCLVVGSRGLGGFRGMLLGSVSHVLLHQATCPLIVVPPREGTAAY
ncbi:nucleotide-binding universal stress UspA family protein [Streptomyces sp. V1I1]|nr:nucleotide-binding universal stress UspA family protein [Streptomyces sp. V1I1]